MDVLNLTVVFRNCHRNPHQELQCWSVGSHQYWGKTQDDDLLKAQGIVRIFCCCSDAKSWLTLYNSIDCSMPGYSVLHCLLEFAQIHVHWVGEAIQPSHPLLPPSSPAFHLSQHQGLFQWVSSSHQVTKVLELQFGISPSNEYSGLISFRIDWFDLLAVQGTLKSLLQHHSSKASILRRSAFFIVQL